MTEVGQQLVVVSVCIGWHRCLDSLAQQQPLTAAQEMPKIAGACPDHLPMFIGMLTLMYVCVCVIVGTS